MWRILNRRTNNPLSGFQKLKMEIDKTKYVTPEYLLSHGFFEYKSEKEGDIHDIPFELENGSTHFREIKFDRRICVVTFSPRMSHEGFDYSVYFQDDAGCGFVLMPFYWWDLPIEYFEAVYYGIRGEKPKLQEPYLSEYEIVKPKELPIKP